MSNVLQIIGGRTTGIGLIGLLEKIIVLHLVCDKDRDNNKYFAISNEIVYLCYQTPTIICTQSKYNCLRKV